MSDAILGAVIGAVVILIVAAFQACVTFLVNRRTTEVELRAQQLALFDRRWDVWVSVRDLLEKTMIGHKNLDQASVDGHSREILKAYFLFDGKAHDFVVEVINKADEMVENNTELMLLEQSGDAEEIGTLHKKSRDISVWARSQIAGFRDTPFAPYIRFDGSGARARAMK